MVFFTRFLANLGIWRDYSPYKDAHDDVYAECMFFIWEVHWKKENMCIGLHAFSLHTALLCLSNKCEQQRWFYLWVRSGSWHPSVFLIRQGLPCGFLPSVVVTLLGYWLYRISDPNEKVCPNDRNYFTSTCVCCTEFASSNLHFASKSIYIEMSNSCW